MKCTHIALQVNNVEKSISFYREFCGMKVIHDRGDADVGRVVWLGWGEDPPKFVIVLLAKTYETNVQPPWQHVGMAVDSRREVDAAYEKAQAAGLENLWAPFDGGAIVGYYCGVPDPDGNMIEFSFGQRIG